jgi:hypothetical protein
MWRETLFILFLALAVNVTLSISKKFLVIILIFMNKSRCNQNKKTCNNNKK